jgi:hypothetical protein
MRRRTRTAAAIGLIALACALGGAACGGSSKEETAGQQTEARWRNGLTRWSNDMLGALNGISLLFSTPRRVDQLQRGEATTSAALVRFERELSGCSAQVNRLGPPPSGLELAQAVALRACTELEQGSTLVRQGVADWQGGLTQAGINAATSTLGAGQDGVARARLELRADASSE